MAPKAEPSNRHRSSGGNDDAPPAVDVAADASAMDVAYEENVRPSLDIIDALRRVGVDKEIDIPQIAVMGDQSSGKSSVLEALSGIPFPRGSGLVTKCATELRMQRAKDKSQWRAKVSLTWDRDHQPEDAGEVSSPEEIGDRIKKLTEILLTARGQGATFEPDHSIRVDLVAPDVPDLTVIDLPGIVRTAVTGQTGDVVGQVDSLLNRYLGLDRTVVLAVIPLTVDVATVDILERAQQVDKLGLRTIGVLTKPDLIDKGAEEEVVDVLQGIKKPLRLGYTMVKNRSQEQITQGMTLAEARRAEQSYFINHPQFGKLDSNYFGVDNLAKTLTSVLVGRIRDTLPAIRREVQDRLKEVSKKLDNAGTAAPSDPQECRLTLNKYLSLVAADIRDSVDGSYHSDFFASSGLQGRIIAQVRMGPWAALQKDVEVSLRPSKDKEGPWSTTVLKERLQGMRGRELPGFTRPDVFKGFVKAYLKDWEGPADSTVDEMTDILERVCTMIVDYHIPQEQLPALSKAMKAELNAAIHRRASQARGPQGVVGLLGDESEPFTLNHYFMDTYNKRKLDFFESNLIRVAQAHHGKLTTHEPFLHDLRNWYYSAHAIGNESNEEQEAQNLQAVLEAYWKTSSKRFIDHMCSRLDNIMLRNLHDELSSSPTVAQLLGDEEALKSLFLEDSFTRENRKRLHIRKGVLENALKVLDQPVANA